METPDNRLGCPGQVLFGESVPDSIVRRISPNDKKEFGTAVEHRFGLQHIRTGSVLEHELLDNVELLQSTVEPVIADGRGASHFAIAITVTPVYFDGPESAVGFAFGRDASNKRVVPACSDVPSVWFFRENHRNFLQFGQLVAIKPHIGLFVKVRLAKITK